KSFVRSFSLLSLDSRQQKAAELTADAVAVTGALQSSWAQAFGRMAMKPWPGYLIVAGILYLMYEFVGVFGAQFLVNVMEKGVFGQILNPAMTKIVDLIVP